MDTLNNIISLMTKEELRNYKLIAQRSHANEERKDVQLFDYIRKSGEKFNERKIIKRLYEHKGKNTYYRLKNRLLTDVSRSLLYLHFDSTDLQAILHYYNLSLLFSKKGHSDTALYFLKKAEKKAESIEHFELLDIIYGEFIRLSTNVLSINPEEFIEKRKKNLVTLNKLRQIDDALAVITYRIKRTQNFTEGDTEILDVLQRTVNEFTQGDEIRESPQFAFKIFEAVSKIFIQRRDFVTLEAYLLATYDEFNLRGLFSRINHDKKLQLLTFLINALYKNKKYSEALKYSEVLKGAMDEYNGQLRDKYMFFYYNSLATNYKNMDNEKAIAIFRKMLENEAITKVSSYLVYIHQNLAMSLFDQKDYRGSLRELVRLQLLDAWKEVVDSMKFQISLFEFVVRFTLTEMETLEYRIHQVKREFSSLILAEENHQEKELIEILEKLTKVTLPPQSKSLLQKTRVFIEKYVMKDFHFLDYGQWLAAQLK